MNEHENKIVEAQGPTGTKEQEPVILELDERLEFGALLIDSDIDKGFAGLDDVQCHCTNNGC